MGDTTFLATSLAHEVERLRDDLDVASFAISVVDENGPIYERAFGESDRERHVPASIDTPYRWGSNSKLFTLLALLQLSARGKVELDAPLIRYLPEFRLRPPPAHLPGSASWTMDQITLRSMLTHHSGIVDNWLFGMFTHDPFPLQEFVTRLNGTHAKHPVGLVHSYSNIAYALLGAVVERVSGLSFDEYAKRHLFPPLGMDRAAFDWNPWLEQAVARPYDGDGERLETYAISALSAGALKASTREMGRFASAILRGGDGIRGRVIDRELLEASFARQNAEVALDFDQKQGLSWIVDKLPVERFGHSVQHGGAMLAHFSEFALLREHGLGVAVVTNSRSGARATQDVAQKALALAIEVKTGRYPPELDDPPELTPAADVEAAVLDRWEGHYATLAGAVELQRDDDELFFEALGQHILLKPLKGGGMGLWLELLGLFDVQPGNLDEQRLLLTNVDGLTVGIREYRGMSRFVSVRYQPTRASEPWQRRVGTYRALTPAADHEIMRGLQLHLDDGQLMLRFLPADLPRGRTPPSLPLRVIDSGAAVSEGVGRGGGLRVEINPRGDLAVLGIAFRKLSAGEQRNFLPAKTSKRRYKPWLRN